MVELKEIYDYMKANLKDTRYIHVLGVVSIAKKLAELNEVDIEKAEIAALCHDVAKNLSKEELKRIIDNNKVQLSNDEENTVELWHSIVAPILIKELFKIHDNEILEATRWHTTGKENMSKLEKIIYIADMIEPSRRFPGVEEIRNVTLNNLDEGVLFGLNHTTKYLLEKNGLIDVNTIKARNYLILNQ